MVEETEQTITRTHDLNPTWKIWRGLRSRGEGVVREDRVSLSLKSCGYVIGEEIWGANEREPVFANGSESEKRFWRQFGEDFE